MVHYYITIYIFNLYLSHVCCGLLFHALRCYENCYEVCFIGFIVLIYFLWY